MAGGIGLVASCYFSYEEGYRKGQQIAQDEIYCKRQEQILRRNFSGIHIDDLISPQLRISCPEVYLLGVNIKEREQ